MNPPAPWRSRAWLAVALILTFFKIWLTRGQGLYAVGSTGDNDRLWVELARHLVQGDGDTGSLYPRFIAAAFGIGLPLFVAQQLFYAAACAWFARALRPAITAAGARCAIYALLLWNPMTFDAPQMGRVLREHLEGPLMMMMVAGLAALYLRRREGWRNQAGWAVLCGLAGAGLFLNDSAYIWLLPAVLVVGTAAVQGARTVSREALKRTCGLIGFAATLAVLLAVAAGGPGANHDVRTQPASGAITTGAEHPDSPSPLASADFLLRFSRFSARPLPSTGTPEQLNLFRDVTGERLSPPTGELDVVGAAEYLQNVAKVDRLHVIGKTLRPFLLILGWSAHLLALARIVQAVRQRQGSFPLTLALAVWSAIAAAILLPGGPDKLSIAAFAPLYPLLLTFIAAVFWDAAAAWTPRRPTAA